MLTYVNKVHLNADNKRANWGWAMVAASLPVFWITWSYHGTQVIPLIIGFNLFLGGLRLVYWGKGGTEKRQSVRKKTSRELEQINRNLK